MTNRLDIGIAGAGIGGLAVAALLARAGHRVSIFDQFESPAPVGSGLVVQPVGQAVLSRLGVLDAALALGARITRMEGTEARSGRRVLDIAYGPGHPNRFGLALHRASLHHILMTAARDAGAHFTFSAEVSATALDGEHRTLTTREGTTRHDLIIDASGADSPLSPLVARLLPFGALWGMVPLAVGTAPDVLAQCYRRADKMVGILPAGRLPEGDTELAAIFWSLPKDGFAAWQGAGVDGWRKEVSALWPAFAPYADAVSDVAQLTFTRYAHGTLRTPYSQRLAFIGDAAHRTSPQLGQGANMALLDAAALADALSRYALADALPEYARSRRWHVRGYQTISRLFTPLYQSHSRSLPVLRDRVLTPLTRIPPAPRVLGRLVSGDLIRP